MRHGLELSALLGLGGDGDRLGPRLEGDGVGLEVRCLLEVG